MRRVLVMTVALICTACGGGTGGSSSTAAKDATDVSNPAPAKGGALDATRVLAGLKNKIATISESIVYTADSDPNNLLGRPGQYTSKAGFHDTRVAAKDVEFMAEPFDVKKGGDIEVFADEAGAKKRADYIGALVNQPGSAILGGPQYIHLKGRVLLRVSGALSPTVDAEYDRAITAVVG